MAKTKSSTERVLMIHGNTGQIKPFTKAYAESDEATKAGWSLHDAESKPKSKKADKE